MSKDEEFHGGWVMNAVWDEEWTETYTDIETYTDSNGNTQTRTVIKTRHHPDNYDVHDSNGYAVNIDGSHFEYLSTRFKNRKTEKPWRSGRKQR